MRCRGQSRYMKKIIKKKIEVQSRRTTIGAEVRHSSSWSSRCYSLSVVRQDRAQPSPAERRDDVAGAGGSVAGMSRESRSSRIRGVPVLQDKRDAGEDHGERRVAGYANCTRPTAVMGVCLYIPNGSVIFGAIHCNRKRGRVALEGSLRYSGVGFGWVKKTWKLTTKRFVAPEVVSGLGCAGFPDAWLSSAWQLVNQVLCTSG